MCRTLKPEPRGAPFALLLLAFSAARLSASLVYSNEVPIPTNGGFFFDQTEQPVNPSAPPIQQMYFVSYHGYYTYNIASETMSSLTPVNAQLDLSSLAAVSQAGTGDNQIFFINSLPQLFTWDTQSGRPIPPFPFLDYVFTANSIAVSPTGTLTLLADGFLYVVDPTTGAGTNELTTTALYQSWGPNGLLYLLNTLPSGQLGIQVLDPNQGYAIVSQFAVLPSTVNEQFAVGPNGDIYVGDGNGGGSYYDSQGNLLGSFDLPPGTYALPSGDSTSGFLATDSAGDVYVGDQTGFHEFANTPEPSALLMGGGGLALLLLRKRAMRLKLI